MGDVYIEQLVKKEPTQADVHKKMSVISAVILLTVLTCVIMGPEIALFFGFLFVLFGYKFIMDLNIEFEYTYTNGTLDIDIIYNRKKRKSLFTGRAGDFQVMAHVSDTSYFEPFKGGKEKNYASGKTKDNTYAFVVNRDQSFVRVVVEPNRELLDAMAKDLTMWKFHKKQA